MKKLLNLCLAAAILCQSNAFAEVTNIAMRGDSCVIKGSGKPGEFVDILLTDGAGKTIDNALGIDSFKLKTTGTFERTIPLAKERIGTNENISAFVKIGDADIEEYKLKYVSQEKIDKAAAAIKGAQSADELKNVIDSNRDVLSAIGFEMDIYDKSDKKNTCEIFFAEKNAADNDALAKSFNTAALLSSYGVIDAAELTDRLDAISPISYNGTAWSSLDDEKKAVAEIIAKNTPYKSMAELNSGLGLGIALNKLNTAEDYTKLAAILSENEDALKIADSADYQYFKNNSTKTAKELFAELKKSAVMTQKDLASSLENAVKTAKSNGSGGGQYSPGGSSGSGSGDSGKKPSGTSVPSGVVNRPQGNVKNDTQETNKQTFIDLVADNWANEAVTALFEKGIVSGYEDGSFKPEKNVSREEFLSMLLRACDIATIGGTCPFEDVEYGKWYSPYVTTAWMKKIVSGIDEKSFGLGTAITRQDIVVILERTGKMYELDDTKKREYVPFDDEGNIAEYAKDAVKSMYEYGVVSGNNGRFLPNDTATRAETAVMIQKFTEILKGAQQ